MVKATLFKERKRWNWISRGVVWGGGGSASPQNLLWEIYRYFLEQHITQQNQLRHKDCAKILIWLSPAKLKLTYRHGMSKSCWLWAGGRVSQSICWSVGCRVDITAKILDRAWACCSCAKCPWHRWGWGWAKLLAGMVIHSSCL